MVGAQVCFHRRYILGHEQPKCSPEEWFESKLGEEMYEKWEKIKTNKIDYLPYLIKEFGKKNLLIPVYADEYGGITIKANGGRAGWDSFDSGQLGFVYAPHEKILEEFGNKNLTEKVLDGAEKCLIAEVDSYNDYLTGNVWGYEISNENGDVLDSCWGLVGDSKYALEEAKLLIPAYVKEREQEEKLLDQRMLNLVVE